MFCFHEKWHTPNPIRMLSRRPGEGSSLCLLEEFLEFVVYILVVYAYKYSHSIVIMTFVSLCRIMNSRVCRQHWQKSGYKLSSLTPRALLMDKVLMDPRDHLIPLSFHLKLFVHFVHLSDLQRNKFLILLLSLASVSGIRVQPFTQELLTGF